MRKLRRLVQSGDTEAAGLYAELERERENGTPWDHIPQWYLIERYLNPTQPQGEKPKGAEAPEESDKGGLGRSRQSLGWWTPQVHHVNNYANVQDSVNTESSSVLRTLVWRLLLTSLLQRARELVDEVGIVVVVVYLRRIVFDLGLEVFVYLLSERNFPESACKLLNEAGIVAVAVYAG